MVDVVSWDLIRIFHYEHGPRLFVSNRAENEATQLKPALLLVLVLIVSADKLRLVLGGLIEQIIEAEIGALGELFLNCSPSDSFLPILIGWHFTTQWNHEL